MYIIHNAGVKSNKIIKCEKYFIFLLQLLDFHFFQKYNVIESKCETNFIFYLGEKKMQKKLSAFNIGDEGVICKVGGDKKIRRRLLDMGLTPGINVYLRKKAPLGDPIEITLRGYELTLRNNEAEFIEMETKE